LFVILLLPQSTASSAFYIGNSYYIAYGGKVDIYTPGYPINVFNNGQSNWISLPLPYWIQAGWRYYASFQLPQKYVEYHLPITNCEIYHQGNQDWGTKVEYKIINVGDDVWCAYINNLGIGCREIVYAPEVIEVMSEIHEDHRIELFTQFENASYRDSSNNYYLFDQGNWFEQFPYLIAIEDESTYLTYRELTYQQFLHVIFSN